MPAGRPRLLHNRFNATKSKTTFSEGNKSAGILDDYAERQNVSTREGTIEHTPTEDNHIVNKEYVDNNDNLHVLKTGDTMTGDLNMEGESGATINIKLGVSGSPQVWGWQYDDDTGDFNFTQDVGGTNPNQIKMRFSDSITELNNGVEIEEGTVTKVPTNNKDLVNKEYVDNTTGDVNGPSSANANAIATFDGTTGKLIKDSGMILEGDKVYQVGKPTTFIKIDNHTIEIWIDGVLQERFS